MKLSFVPLSSFAFEVLQSRYGSNVPNLISRPSTNPNGVDLYELPPYEVGDMFILCKYVALLLGGCE